jgi:hypothetical protein
MEEGPINHWKFKYGDFILHILHSLFDKMLYSVYVHSKNNIPILYIVFLCSFVAVVEIVFLIK